MVDTPLPLSAFLDTLLQNQRGLIGSLASPIITNIALLTLSQPVSSIIRGGLEILIMCFFGVYWIFDPHTGRTGFFASEESAVEYLRASKTWAE